MGAGEVEGQVLEDALRRYLEADNESLEEDKVAQAVQDAMTAGMEHVLADLKAKAPQTLADRRADRIGFQARLYATWREAFDLYEITYICAEEAGAHFNEKYRPEAAENNDIVFDVLVRLHARACHIAAEIYSLLRSGQATGAMARWRSLHEVSIVTFLAREYRERPRPEIFGS